MNTYRALTPQAVAMFEEGVFEAEFTPAQERDWLDSGLLELVPRRYRVLSDNYELPKDNTFVATMLVEIEAMLTDAGHIERVDDEPEEAEQDEEPDDDEPDDVEPEEEPEAVADEPTKEEE
ncbi:MAG TPA: hypothetical protein VFR23_20200 [Jiangellaceae bacterium]|nr:hypothetical protein [Jiangellaceae bacterium]